MMTEQTKATTYNGWTNYETWCVNLWMENERESSDYKRELAELARKDARATTHAYWTPTEHETFILADCLKDWMEELSPLADDASLWSDLLSAALSEVNWREIAEITLSGL